MELSGREWEDLGGVVPAPGQDSNPNMDTYMFPFWITGFSPKQDKGGGLTRVSSHFP